MKKTAFIASLLILFQSIWLPFESHAQQPPDISAKSAILINATTGTVLYEHNAYAKRAMASTTKIMTALLTIEAGDLDKPFTVDSYAVQVEGTAMGLKPGDIVTRRALVYGMMLPSGNDAANAAAVNISGSLSAFAQKMNEKAKQLGMTNTNFVNPSGLDADGHYTTAYDLAILTQAALQNPLFREVCRQREFQVDFGNPPYTRTLKNSNKLLRFYPDCIGVKTGFTDNARRCLVSAAEKNGVTLIAVTLNDPDDWDDHTALLEYGFSLVQLRAISASLEPMTIPVVGGTVQELPVKLKLPAMLPLSESEVGLITVKNYIKPFVYAPVRAGEVVGYSVYFIRGRQIFRSELVVAESSEAAQTELSFFDGLVQSVRRVLQF